jgi:hypothetical protein
VPVAAFVLFEAKVPEEVWLCIFDWPWVEFDGCDITGGNAADEVSFAPVCGVFSNGICRYGAPVVKPITGLVVVAFILNAEEFLYIYIRDLCIRIFCA